ncbi:hypothetical protein QAD02_001571 [Eretmocerus hayati]|uniref:Uncharacterized protein n=1 Tax=Eretmocerus hayati TaxID=131215 RepID=A0ACC2NGT3_9HYME|nr:hypothetical protein QAD02_001571 [Eretmocerus hayati]
MFWILIATTFTSISCIAYSGSRSPRLVGGTRASIEDFPYMVSLHYLDSFICGGTLIDQGVILTAAHCLDGKWDYRKFKARVGSNYQGKGGTLYRIDRIIFHRDYIRNIFENDIALMRLKDYGLSNRIFPTVKLYSRSDYPERNAILLGWGTADSQNPTPSAKLKMLDFNISTKAECEAIAGSFLVKLEKRICAKHSHSKSDCHGDSGGPLIIHGLQAGIVSSGNGCGTIAIPSFYTEVSSFLLWIAEKSLDIMRFSQPRIVAYPLNPSDVKHNEAHRGEKVNILRAPYLVAIKDRDNGVVCSGIIVGSKYVLTSALCASIPLDIVFVQSETADLTSQENLHKITGSFLHDDYDINSSQKPINNIGLMVVDPRFPDTTIKAEIAPSNARLERGDIVTIFGWGTITDEKKGTKKKLPASLRSLDMAYIPEAECNASYWNYGGVPPNQFCAFSSVGTCIGDPGGPLVAHLPEPQVIGIQSWSYEECTDHRWPPLYTDISIYREWIEHKILLLEKDHVELR